MLVDGNYLYVFQKDLSDGVQSWECQLRRKQQCKAQVKLQNDRKESTSLPLLLAAPKSRLRVAMKRRGETTTDAPQRILSEGFAQVSPAAAVNLPPIAHIGWGIRRHIDNEGNPANPVDRASIPVIPNEFQTTDRGDRFLLYDSGVGDVNRILLFATDQGLNLLSTSDNWFGNGTFDVSPDIFFQVYTIHAMCRLPTLLYWQSWPLIWMVMVQQRCYSTLKEQPWTVLK